MYRWTTLTLGLMLAGGLTAILVGVPHTNVSAAPTTSVSGTAPTASSAPPPEEDTEIGDVAGADKELEPAQPEPVAFGPLPASAPKRVTFGVVLLRYRGAEGAPATARSKEAAKRLAESLIPEALEDFAAAVQRGDRGSTTNAGRLPQDVLEPTLEYALFSLEPGKVHPEPVDSPRGFWIIKRVK